MTDEVCLTRRDGHVFVVTLNRPAKRNALNAELRAALRAAFDEFDEDPDLRCAVLTDNGPVFCAGGDLVEMASQQVQIPPAEWACYSGRGARCASR